MHNIDIRPAVNGFIIEFMNGNDWLKAVFLTWDEVIEYLKDKPVEIRKYSEDYAQSSPSL